MFGKYIKLFISSAILLVALSIGLIHSQNKNAVNACEGDWTLGKCIATECGTTEGKRNDVKYEEVCDYSCPVIHFVWYGHSFNVEYEKSADPNKCHRPSDNTLSDSYGMNHDARQAFKNKNSEWKDSIESNCNQEQVDTRTVDCNDAEPFDCPVSPTPTEVPSPQCRNDQVLKDNGCVCPEGKVEYNEQCVIDLCPNVEGVQLNTELCPEITVTPTPEVTPSEPSQGGVGGGPVAAPVCGAATPSVPYLVSADYLGGNKIKITWNKVINANSYSIFYGPSTGNYLYGVPSTGNSDNFTIEGLSKGCFVIHAINDCAPSGPSNEVCSGAIASNVLGASTMGGTGSSLENLFYYIYFMIGAATSGLGLIKLSSSRVK